MTYKEYAEHNLKMMKQTTPTAQNMRDIALLSLWLRFEDEEYNHITDDKNETETKTEGEYNALPSYQKYKENKNADNLRDLCCEIEKICREIYLDATTDEQRNIYLNMANKL